MSRSTTVLVAYDVADDRLRQRLARLLEGYGTRVQQSVFECPLRAAERDALLRRLREVLPADDDAAFSVRCYHLGMAAHERTTILGTGSLSEDASFHIV